MNNKTDDVLPVKIISYAFIVTAGVATVLAELSVAGIIVIPLSVTEEVFGILLYVCAGIALLVTVVSLFIRRMIHQVDSNRFHPVLLFWAKQLKQQSSGTAAILMVPLALCEIIILIGFLLLILSGNQRVYFYTAVIWSLSLILLHFPAKDDEERLSKIDEQIDRT